MLGVYLLQSAGSLTDIKARPDRFRGGKRAKDRPDFYLYFEYALNPRKIILARVRESR